MNAMIHATLVSRVTQEHGTSGEMFTINGGALTAADVADFQDKGTSVIGDQDMCSKPHYFLPSAIYSIETSIITYP